MNSTQLINEIDKLKLPIHEYIVVGGGALAIRDIRETSDIDIVVTPKLFEELKNNPDWIYKVRPNGKPKLYHHVAEIYLDVNTENFSRTTNELFEHADIFHEVQFIDLHTLAKFKKYYGREKDAQDLELIYAALG